MPFGWARGFQKKSVNDRLKPLIFRSLTKKMTVKTKTKGTFFKRRFFYFSLKYVKVVTISITIREKKFVLRV